MLKTFDDFKKEIDLVDFAIHNGYVIKSGDGMKWPSLIHKETGDSIIVSPNHRMYREKHNPDAGGNIMRFISDRANTIFKNFNVETDPSKFYTLYNKVCYDFLNITPEQKKAISTHVPENVKVRNQNDPKFFTLEALNVTPLSDSYYLVKTRMLDPAVLKDPIFAPKLVNQTTKLDTGKEITNSGFIYTTSVLENQAVGLEVRNSNFKSHAEGSDRSHGVGFSALTDQKIDNLVVGESYIDQMSYHQMHGTPTNLYASIGGQLTTEQLNAITASTVQLKSVDKLGENFKYTLAFDNDLSGHGYDFQFIRKMGSDSGEALAISKVFAQNNINNNMAFIFYDTPKLSAILPAITTSFDKLNSQISNDNKQADLFKLTTKVDANVAYRIEFPKNPKYFELFNNVLIKALKLENRLVIHKAINNDFNDDLKAGQGRKIAERPNDTVELNFKKLNTSIKL